MQLNRDGEVLSTPQGVLLKSLTHSDAGLYHCLATENNFKHTLARVSLRILDRDIAVALTVPDDEDKERDIMRRDHKPEAHSQAGNVQPLEPEMRVIHQYCQSYWEQLIDQGQQQSKHPNRRHTEGREPSGGWGWPTYFFHSTIGPFCLPLYVLREWLRWRDTCKHPIS